MDRKAKDTFKRILFYIYKLGTRIGIHILPVHYYSPVPNIIELEKTKEIWARKSELPGISMNLEEQMQNLRKICLPYQNEYIGNLTYKEAVSKHFGPGFGYIEAQALHAVIRYYKPQRVIEVGSGVSTYCSLTALKMNEGETGNPFSITCIEPYASERLKSLSQIELIQQKVQTVSIRLFDKLGENDILFIDSSHCVKPGSDVNHIILEILPRLKPGVIIHFHDIQLPFDYQRNVLKTFLHWTETSLLRAFLINNDKVKIVFCLSNLHYECKSDLKEIFPDYLPQVDCDGLVIDQVKPFEDTPQHFPSSIYIQIK
jgi:hypothetical protein